MAGVTKRKKAEARLRAACQAKGLKATRQRLEILEIVCAARNHPTVDSVYRLVKARIPRISFDTVYRTLSSFEEHKLISRVHHLDDKTRYDSNTSEHHHFVCTSCKEISDFDWPEFASLKLPPASPNFARISQRYVEITVIRPTCARK